jgi:predicted kinase
VALTDRGKPEIYSEEFTARTYDEVFRRAAAVLDSGRSVVLDATFRTPLDRQRARQLASARGARFCFVDVSCDEAVLRQRLRARAGGPAESDADEHVLDQLRGQFVPPHELGPDERLAWRSDGSEQDLVAAVRSRWPGLTS